jgi:hypothetical protein
MVNRLQALKSTAGIHGVAFLLGFQPKSLAYILYKMTDAAKYSQFQISKRSGGSRTIKAPSAELKHLQSRLSDLLQDCISDINTARRVSSSIAHGFRRNCSIVSNANEHKHKRYVFNLDLSDFFDTINFGRVRGFFISNRNFQLDPATATILAQIACHNNALPQGSPCSPVISNLVGHILDIRLAALAADYGCDYSRYADDLTFSTNKLRFPECIARIQEDTHIWEPGKKLRRAIERAGFQINDSKTRMQYRQSRQDVTGLVVNEKVNTRIEYYREARSKCNALFQKGSFHNIVLSRSANGDLIETAVPGTVEQLNGVLSFIDFVKGSNKSSLKPAGSKKLTGPEALYSRFLLYRHFFINSRPIIICEGKTDNIYVRCAIKRLYKKYRSLAQLEDKQVKVRVQLFNYTETSARVLGLGGGTGYFNDLIQRYRKERLKFKSSGESQPVIFLVDNDSGADCVFSAIKQSSGKKLVDKNEPFYWLGHNLYVVLTPRTGANGDTMIEDFFDESVRATKLGGKTFNPHKGFDQNKQYGKYLFAEHVIGKNQEKIDFSGFEPLLDRITAVLKDNKKRIKAAA